MINGLGRCDWAFGRAVRGIDVNVGFGFRGSIRERRELDRIMLVEESFIKQC
jgi:hypothetical protein